MERESDGRFALTLPSEKAVKRDLKREEEREKRRKELEDKYGDDACMFA